MSEEVKVLNKVYNRLVKKFDRALDTGDSETVVNYSQALAYLTEAMGNLRYLQITQEGDGWKE